MVYYNIKDYQPEIKRQLTADVNNYKNKATVLVEDDKFILDFTAKMVTDEAYFVEDVALFFGGIEVENDKIIKNTEEYLCNLLDEVIVDR